MQMALCVICTQLFRQRRRKGSHHNTGTDLVRAAASGCFVCRAVVEEYAGKVDLIDLPHSWTCHLENKSLRISHSYASWKCDFDVYLVEDQTQLARRLSSISPSPSIRGPPWQIVQDELWLQLPESTGHPDVLALAKEWLDVCRTSHTACRRIKTEKPWFPPRLLDLTLRPPRLIETAYDVPKSPYAVLACVHLSASSTCRLTLETAPAWSKTVPFEQLQLTHRQGIQTAEALGFKYLWIDAL